MSRAWYILGVYHNIIVILFPKDKGEGEGVGVGGARVGGGGGGELHE